MSKIGRSLFYCFASLASSCNAGSGGSTASTDSETAVDSVVSSASQPSVSGSGSAGPIASVVPSVNNDSSKEGVPQQIPGALLVESAKDQDKCDKQTKNRLIYVLDQREFRVCDGINWVMIDISGSIGATGSQGPQGLIGPTGLAGAAGATGSQGPQGPTGPKGDAGDRVVGGILRAPDGTTVGQIVDIYEEYTSDGKVKGAYFLVTNGSHKTLYSKSNNLPPHASDGSYFRAWQTRGNLVRVALPVTALIYTSLDCTGAPYLVASTSGAFKNCVGYGCSWDVNNGYISAFANQNIIYSYNSNDDYKIDNDCMSGTLTGAYFNSAQVNGGCTRICSNNSYSSCASSTFPSAAYATGCSFTRITKEFPDSVANGWTITAP